MKVFLSILIACLCFFSCSKSEEEEEGSVTYVDASVDGTVHMFNSFFVDKETTTVNGSPVTIVSLAASIENNPNRVMAFKFRQGELGFEACTSVKYIEEGAVYERFDDSFSIEVVESNSYRIRGVFSGNLKNLQTGEIVAVSGGGFDLFYNVVTP
ncbi:MAG TPA: hypothetical protein VGB43_00310 [Flavobacterium sp.]